jgi:hypothetical protein
LLWHLLSKRVFGRLRALFEPEACPADEWCSIGESYRAAFLLWIEIKLLLYSPLIVGSPPSFVVLEKAA